MKASSRMRLSFGLRSFRCLGFSRSLSDRDSFLSMLLLFHDISSKSQPPSSFLGSISAEEPSVVHKLGHFLFHVCFLCGFFTIQICRKYLTPKRQSKVLESITGSAMNIEADVNVHRHLSNGNLQFPRDTLRPRMNDANKTEELQSARLNRPPPPDYQPRST